MRKLIISSLALLCAVSVYAQEDKEREVASDETVSSDDVGTGSLYKNYDCSNCGGKTKK